MVQVKKLDTEGKKVMITYTSLFDVYKQLEEKKEEVYNASLSRYWLDYILSFHYFQNFEEALNALKNGWEDGAKKINDMLTKTYISANKTKTISKYDVVGFQASVPRYLQGIPTNMINQKKMPAKQKVVTIVKHIGFLGNVKSEEIMENSVKALAIIKRMEEQGTRCNLDIISPVYVGDFLNREECEMVIRIRIKNSTERLNVGKFAFAIANPDMLRRIVFALRYTAFSCGYLGNCEKNPLDCCYLGATCYDREKVINDYLNPGEKYLHNFIDNIDEEIAAFNKM